LKQLVTYAQNREDLFLYALLGHVEKGFFVDIGAYHPVLHSVTKLFSDLGWNGINVEANKRLFGAFETDRANETNVCAAISDHSGTVTFRDYPQHDGLSTVSTGVQDIHAAASLPYVDVEVQSITLSQLFEDSGVINIDFLKVDVEGHEVEVLSSNDWSRWRPTVVTFEANRGQDAIDCVAQHGYRLEFFDGLNHYMVAHEAIDVSILNFAGRILHRGFLTRYEEELRSQNATFSVEVPQASLLITPLQSPRTTELGMKGSAKLLSKAIQRRIGSRPLGAQALDVVKAAAARGSILVESRKQTAQPVLPSLAATGGDYPGHSPRVRTALASMASAENDFFGGWTPDDVALFETWRTDVSNLTAQPGELLDWLGCRTALAHHSWLNHPQNTGLVIADIPVPDDQVHAEAIEYFALITSLNKADKRSFCVMELGASYAPWSVAACVVANRVGFQSVHGVAVEANAGTLPNIHEHVGRNNLKAKGIRFDVLHGAVSTTSEPLFFPTVDTASDNGAQATKSPGNSDYRGVNQQYAEVPGLTLKNLAASTSRVDFLHMDLQGAEEELFLNDEFLAVLSEKVGVLMLATQSRLVEGLALRERPTTFKPNERTLDVNGWTLRDGAQVWTNLTIG
jgi:FkbM family methyltransferase